MLFIFIFIPFTCTPSWHAPVWEGNPAVAISIYGDVQPLISSCPISFCPISAVG